MIITERPKWLISRRSFVGSAAAAFACAPAFAQPRAPVSITQFGAVADGITDNFAAFRAACEALPQSGGTIRIPAGRYLIDFSGADVLRNRKIAMQIEKPDVFIEGEGDATVILMGGIGLGDLLRTRDPAAAGNDVATLFNFQDVEGGGVGDLRILGEWDGAGELPVGAPRAKGVGVMNARRIRIARVTGSGIAGNLINLRGNRGIAERSTAWCTVEACEAELCLENGINFMGGTFDCAITASLCSRSGYHGFESGTKNLRCEGNRFFDNRRWGISQVGSDGRIADNETRDNGMGGIHLQYNNERFGGSRNEIAGNRVHETAATVASGVAVDGGCNDFSVIRNEVVTGRYAILVNGNSSRRGCHGFTISDNDITMAGRAPVDAIRLNQPASARLLSDNRTRRTGG